MFFMFAIQYAANVITLPSPEKGDSVDYNLQTAIKYAQNGAAHTYVRNPVIQTRQYAFDNVPGAAVSALRSLLKDYKDKVFQFTSYNGSTFAGQIINDPDYEIVQYSPCVKYAFELEIQV